MGAIASQITSLTIVYSTVYSDADQGKHQSSASLVFVWGIHRWPVNSPHKWPVTRKMFPFDDVIMNDLIVIRFVLYPQQKLAAISRNMPWVFSRYISCHLQCLSSYLRPQDVHCKRSSVWKLTNQPTLTTEGMSSNAPVVRLQQGNGKCEWGSKGKWKVWMGQGSVCRWWVVEIMLKPPWKLRIKSC